MKPAQTQTARRSVEFDVDWDSGLVTAHRPLAGYPGWHVIAIFAAVDGTIDVVELAVAYAGDLIGTQLEDWIQRRSEAMGPAAKTPPGGITTRMMRSVRWGAMEADARRQLKRHLVGPASWRGATLRAKTKTDSRTWTDKRHAALAARYVALLDKPKAVQRLAAQVGEPAGTVSNRIAKARRLNLLTHPSTPGRQGGQLTERAKEILDGID